MTVGYLLKEGKTGELPLRDNWKSVWTCNALCWDWGKSEGLAKKMGCPLDISTQIQHFYSKTNVLNQ